MNALSEPQRQQDNLQPGAPQDLAGEPQLEQERDSSYLKDIIYLTLLRQKIDGSVFDADFCDQKQQPQQSSSSSSSTLLHLPKFTSEPSGADRLLPEKPSAARLPHQQQPEACCIRVHLPELKSEIEIDCRPRDSFWHLKLCLIDGLLFGDSPPAHLYLSNGDKTKSASSLVSQLLSSRSSSASIGRHSLAARARNVISRRLSQAPRCRSSGGSMSSADAASCCNYAAAARRPACPEDSRSLSSSAFYYGFGSHLSGDEAAAVKALVLATGASSDDNDEDADEEPDDNNNEREADDVYYDVHDDDEHPYATLTTQSTTCSGSERRLSTLLSPSDGIGLLEDDECANLTSAAEARAGSQHLFEQALASGYLNHGFYSFSLGRFLDDQTPLTDYLSLVSSSSGASYYLDLEFKAKQRASAQPAPPPSGRSLINVIKRPVQASNLQRLSLANISTNSSSQQQVVHVNAAADSMIARLSAGSASQVRRQSAQTAGQSAASSSQSRRKRAKLLEVLLTSNWGKQSQQTSSLLKLNKILLVCDPNFLDEKSGQSPLSLAISSTQINGSTNQQSSNQTAQALLQATSSIAATGSNPQSASLLRLQCQALGANLQGSASNTSSATSNQLLLQQTNTADLIHSKTPLIERLLMLLVKSGALIDFRNCDGRTPLHVAAMKSNFWALKTLLELGASTDYRDINGLTPLYYSILHKADLKVTQLLLNHRQNPADFYSEPVLVVDSGLQSINKHQLGNLGIGITDQHNWQEVHQACKLGLDAHLEKLLYYGCDINAKISGSGNTPLHVAAINDQLNCAKVLLMRGADKTITNNSHQTAHQVAVVSNNMDLAEFIAEHNDSKVIPFRDRPANYLDLAALQGSCGSGAGSQPIPSRPGVLATFGAHVQQQMNPLSLDVPAQGSAVRSAGSAGGSQPQSLLSIASSQHHQLHPHNQLNNISPCLSQRSFATSNTTSSSGVCCDGDGNNSAEEAQQARLSGSLPNSQSQQSNVTIIAINNDKTNNHLTLRKLREADENDAAHEQVRSDLDEDRRSSSSSSNGSTNGLCSLMSEERPLYAGTLVEACSEYQSGDPNHLQLRRGDRVQVLEYSSELLLAGPVPRLANKPMLYGRRLSDNSTGLFPSICVQRAKHNRVAAQRRPMADLAASYNTMQAPRQGQVANCIRGADLPESQSMIALDKRQEPSLASAFQPPPPKALEESTWQLKSKPNLRELQVSLSKTKEGFGFALRGAKIDPQTLSACNGQQENADQSLAETLLRANNLVSLQYLDEIEPGSVAERAGLRRGDHLLAVNQQDVRSSSHEQVVRMIRLSGDSVHLTVATPTRECSPQPTPPPPLAPSMYSSKTLGRVKPEPPKRDPNTTLTRNRGQRVKSMLIQPMRQEHAKQDTPFDANKPLPQAPAHASPMSPTGSLNLMGRSISTNLEHFHSAQSLTGRTSDAQSITSISTLSEQQVGADSQQPTPTHSSSSTATLTTVAAVKPKAPPKPVGTSLPLQQQASYRPAIITTSRRASQAAGSPPSPARSSARQSPPEQQVAAAIPAPPPPPPSPPPMLAPTGVARSEQRRTSAPVSELAGDSSRLQKKRESLAVVPQVDRNSTAVPASAQFGSVAAACAAAANNRIQRQLQQQRQQQEQESQVSQVDPQKPAPKPLPEKPQAPQPTDDQHNQQQQEPLETAKQDLVEQHEQVKQQELAKQQRLVHQQRLEKQRQEQLRLEQQQRQEQQRQEQRQLEQQRQEQLKQLQQQQLLQQQQQQQLLRQQQLLAQQQQPQRQSQLLLQQQHLQQQQQLLLQQQQLQQRVCHHQSGHEHHHARAYSTGTSGAARGHHLHHQVHQVQPQQTPAQVVVTSKPHSHHHHHHAHHHHHQPAAHHHNYGHYPHHQVLHNHHSHNGPMTNAVQQQQQPQQQQQQYHQRYVALTGVNLYDCQGAAISGKRSAY